MLGGRRPAAGLAVVAVLVLTPGCGRGQNPVVGDGQSAASRTPTTAPSATTPSSTTVPPSSAPTTAPAGGTGSGSGSPTATAPPSSGGDPGGGGQPGDGSPAERLAPEPGTYPLRVSGSATFNGEPQPVPPESELVIEQLSATDQRHTSEDGEQVLRYTPDAVLLVSLRTGEGGFTKTFVPAEPVLLAPRAGAEGDSWSWTVTSDDGLTTLDQRSTITGTETVTIGGQPVDTTVIDTLITLSGDVNGTVDVTTWASPEHLLAVRSHSVTDARAGVFRFGSDITVEHVGLQPR